MGKRPMCLVCILLAAVLCFADWLGISFVRGNPLPEALQAWIKSHPDAVIFGEVQQCAETENSQSIYLKNVSLLLTSERAEKSEKLSSQKVSIENVRVFLKKESVMEKIPAGTFLKVSGRLVRVPETRNPGEFDSQQYYACRHIYYYLKEGVIEEKSESFSAYLQGLLNIRERLADIFENAAGSDAPVFEAMVLGEKSSLEDETKIRYQMAGMIHILAISGMHISLLGEGVNCLLKKTGFGIFISGMLSLGLMVQYGMMTGGSVAAMRAVCMFLMSMGAQLLGRCYDSLNALGLSALILLLNAPANLYSSGFLLSFGAVLGIRTGAVFTGLAGTKNKILSALISSVSVQMATLPVMLYFYGEVSVIGVFLNLLVLPTVGIVLASGALGGLAGLFSMKAAGILLVPGRILLLLYDTCCEAAGKLPWCTWIGGQPKLWQAGIYYGLFFAALFTAKWYARRKESRHFRRDAGILCAVLISAGVFILGWHYEQGLTITCLDVGQGDGIVLETSEGYDFLIDGGSSSKSKIGQYQILPYLKSRGISCLDGILVSHTDNDHISGITELLDLMENGLTGIRAEKLILPGWTEKNEAYEELEQKALGCGMDVIYGNCGDVLQAGRMKILFLAPGNKSSLNDELDINEEGMVWEVRYGNFRGLFTGDIGEEAEGNLLPLLSDVDFLKVAHHGSRYSTGMAFLEKVRPELGVISCSSTNIYGHPSQETIERLRIIGCQVEYTMKSGAVKIWTDGQKKSVTRWISRKQDERHEKNICT